MQGSPENSGTQAAAPSDRIVSWLCLAAILAIAIALRAWDFGEHAFITPYYLAGVRSMLNSWHNFFFNAFDPAGFVSLDKPPVAFWLQTASAKFFGFSPAAVLLPQLAEGVSAILLLYVLLRRRCGETAALLAALFLALTPIAVAVDRSNNTESCLVLVLIAAAWALTRAVESGMLRFAVLAAVLVGLGFNTKMLLAFGVLPGFALLYLLAAPVTWGARFGHLSAAAATLAAVSLAWVLAYDLTPVQDRPFVDSTRDNSMLELVVGHNGIQRFVRPMAARRHANADTAQPAAAPVTDRQGANFIGRDTAPAGTVRLAAPRLAAQMGWWWPLVLIGGVAAWIGAQRHRPPAPERLQLALWSGWTLGYGVVLSAAGGLFHAYYLVVMAPALAALAGIGLSRLWLLYRRGGSAALLPATLLATAAWQAYVLDEFVGEHLALGKTWPVPAFLALAAVATAGLTVLPRLAAPKPALLAAAVLPMLLLLPATWSIGTALAPGISGFPAARPPLLNDNAQTQRLRWSMVAGGIAGDARLIDFLRQHVDGEEFMLAAVNARLAAPLIIATGAPVMALGGFSGGDPILDVDGFARLVAAGRVRYALVGDGSPGLRRIFGDGRQQDLVAWIRQFGRPVDPAAWRSADGVAEAGRGRGAEMIDTELYDLRPTTAEH